MVGRLIGMIKNSNIFGPNIYSNIQIRSLLAISIPIHLPTSGTGTKSNRIKNKIHVNHINESQITGTAVTVHFRLIISISLLRERDDRPTQFIHLWSTQHDNTSSIDQRLGPFDPISSPADRDR